MSNKNSDDQKTCGLGNNYRVNGKTGIKENNSGKMEISNIQNCSLRCTFEQLKVQGKDHAKSFNNGPVYGSYAIYLANNTTKFPTDQKLTLLMKSKTLTLVANFFGFSLHSEAVIWIFPFLSFFVHSFF